MKFKKKKVAAVALSALFVCGALSGCDLVTADSQKDLLQVVAEVDITKGEEFQNGGEFASYASVIKPSKVLKRDLVARFMTVGYQYVNSFGYTYARAFDQIMRDLVQNRIYLQYGMVYLMENNDDYSVEGLQAATSAEYADVLDLQIAQLEYFLDEKEEAVAEYSVKQSLNATIDAQEAELIDEQHDHDDHDTARTTPTGVDTEVEDYYDEAYKVYTGYNSASDCGSYETQDGSKPTLRRQAYGQFLASLDTYALIGKGEDTTSVDKLTYYKMQLKSAYESAMTTKLSEAFEEEAKATVTKEWVEAQYAQTLQSQQKSFADDSKACADALDKVSDSSFVLYAPENYGYVINILLPFSTTQAAALKNMLADSGDTHGNKFQGRAKLLKDVVATDQRKTWFTGEEDYSFEAAQGDSVYNGGDSARTHLFFENSLKKPDHYESIPNYLGAYSYNGTVKKDSDDDYVITPKDITVDGFLDEMKGYLGFAGYSVINEKSYNANGGYYAQDSYYNEKGEVDYSKFVYYTGEVAKDGKSISETFNANNVFVNGSTENKAMSVMNELSFAYNTDTAGLNDYLGYVVSPSETTFVKEFEYAAQLAVRGGAGTIVVAPSDYGWHVIYCTFSYGNSAPYTFDWNEIEAEGTFSNLYFEALKSSNLTTYASDRQKQLINKFYNDDCVTRYEKRYADLIEAGDGSNSGSDDHDGHNH